MKSVTKAAAGSERGGHRVRELSRALVLSELQRGLGATQPELVRKTGLARATVAAVIAELTTVEKVTEGHPHNADDRGGWAADTDADTSRRLPSAKVS